MRALKPHRALQSLRAAVGLSQVKFAALVGRSAAAIESIECGRLDVTDDLAHRITAFTGVDPESIIDPNGKPLTLYGVPYTQEAFAQWREHVPSEEEKRRVFERCVFSLQILLNAAFENSTGTEKTPAKFRAFVYALSRWMEEQRKDFGLAETTQALLRDHFGKTEVSQTTIGNLRKALKRHPEFVRHNRREWKNSQPAKISEIVYPLWTPISGTETITAKGEPPAKMFVTEAFATRRELHIEVGEEKFRIIWKDDLRFKGIGGSDAERLLSPKLPQQQPSAQSSATRADAARGRSSKKRRRPSA